MFHDAIFVIILYFMTGTLMMHLTGNLKCARIPPSTMPSKSTRRNAPHTGNEVRSVDFLLIGQVARQTVSKYKRRPRCSIWKHIRFAAYRST